VTVINPQPVVKTAEAPTPTRLENTLRAKIQAAKAKKN
jgi:hypothetical protein